MKKSFQNEVMQVKLEFLTIRESIMNQNSNSIASAIIYYKMAHSIFLTKIRKGIFILIIFFSLYGGHDLTAILGSYTAASARVETLVIFIHSLYISCCWLQCRLVLTMFVIYFFFRSKHLCRPGANHVVVFLCQPSEHKKWAICGLKSGHRNDRGWFQ